MVKSLFQVNAWSELVYQKEIPYNLSCMWWYGGWQQSGSSTRPLTQRKKPDHRFDQFDHLGSSHNLDATWGWVRSQPAWFYCVFLFSDSVSWNPEHPFTHGSEDVFGVTAIFFWKFPERNHYFQLLFYLVRICDKVHKTSSFHTYTLSALANCFCIFWMLAHSFK